MRLLNLRSAASGALFLGDADGDTLQWDEPAQKWRAQQPQTGFVVYLKLNEGDDVETAVLNTAIVQEAVDELGARGGGVIQFPQGQWYLYPVGIVHSNVHIRGAGRGATELVMGASPDVNLNEMFRFGISANGSTPVPINNCSAASFSGNGNRANQVNGSDPAGSNAAIIGVATVVGFTAYDLEIYECDGYGISFFGTDFAHRSDWYVGLCELHHCNYDGVDIKGGGNGSEDNFIPARVLMEFVYSHDNGPGNIVGRDSVGFDLRGEQVTLVACCAEANATSGIRCRDGADGCYSATVVGCSAYGNTGAGFQVDGIATGVYRFVGGEAVGNTQWGCRAESGRTILEGVRLAGQLRGLTNFSTAAVIEATDCIIEQNSDYGIRVDPTGSSLKVNGGAVQLNGLEGIRVACGRVRLTDVDVLDNSQGAGSHAGILLLSTCTYWRIQHCRSTNQAGATQNYGIEFQGGLPAGVLQALITGNANAPTSGVIPVGTLYYGTSGITVPINQP